MEIKERCAKGHWSTIENSFRSKKVGSYLTVFNRKQLHREIFCNNLFFFRLAEDCAVSKEFKSLNVVTLFWFPLPTQFRRCDAVRWVSVCLMEVSGSVSSLPQDPGVKCSKVHIWWSRNSLAFAALPMAVVDGKQWIQNSQVGWAIVPVSFASGTLDIATWELHFICSQMFAAEGPHFRAEISATQPTSPASTAHK